MILTGSEIEKKILIGDIIISPFEISQLNPNSYNYRLGSSYKCISDNKIKMIPKNGLLLIPKKLYLCSTYEKIGSSKFVTSLIGRSSLGRLGLFLQCHSDMGNLGDAHKWTLEISCIQPIIIYPKMSIGQVSFWSVNGEIKNLYRNNYSKYNGPHQSDLS